MDIRGGIAHLDLNQLLDELIDRIANGENIMSVLASAVPTRKDGSIDTAKLLPALTKRGPDPSDNADDNEPANLPRYQNIPVTNSVTRS